MVNLLSVISRSKLASFWTTDFADAIGDFVGSILWLFSDLFFWLLDMFEDLYRKFAGIDTNVTTAVGRGGEKIEGDLVLYFIQSNIVQQIFMSILVLSLFLLIIFTIFAIVKNQYAEKQEPVSKIINSSFKALLMYLLVPIATVVCLLVGNVVLQAIDGATKTNDYAQTISDNLFSTATYNANRLRFGTTAEKARQLKNMLHEDVLPQHIKDLIEQECNVNLSNPDSFNMEYVATGESVVDYDTMAVIIDEAFLTGNLKGQLGADSDKWTYAIINNFYYGHRISYIIIWIGGAFLIWAIGKITWGLVARLFKMTLFYAISPAVMATFPLDNGKALGSWRGEMVKNGTMALCSVGILNVLYSVLPAFNNIDLYGDTTHGGGIASSIARLFIYIIAFASAKDLVGAISGWFGVGNALDEGIKAKGTVTKPIKSATSKTIGAFAGISGGIAAARDHGGNKLWGAISGGLSATPLGKMAFGEEFKKGKEAGEKSYKTSRTFSLDPSKGFVNKKKLAEYEAYDERAKIQKRYRELSGEALHESSFTLDEGVKKGDDGYDLSGIDEYKAKFGTDAYDKEVEVAKRIGKVTDAGKRMYYKEYEDLERDEKKYKEAGGYYKKFTHIKDLQGKVVDRKNSYEEYAAKQMGVDVATFSNISPDIVDAMMAGNVEKLGKMKDQAYGSEETKKTGDMLATLLGNMTEQVVAKLNDLQEAQQSATEALQDAVVDMNEDITASNDMKDYALEQGFLKKDEDGKVGAFAISADFDKTISAADAKLNDFADKVDKTKDALDMLAAGAAKRHMLGTSTKEEKERMEKYNATHPKDS